MSKLAVGITHHKKLVVTIFSVVLLASLVMMLMVNVNYNIVDYLPEDAQSTKALEIMQEEFNGELPNTRVMIPDVSVQEALDFKKKLDDLDGVSNVLWLDNVIDLRVPLEMADKDTVESYYKDNNASFSLTVRSGDEVEVVDAIYALVGEKGYVSGNAVSTASAQKMTGTESTNAMLILIPLIILILVLSTTSWIEPVLFLLAIGVSVAINMGTNIFLGNVSFVTSSVSPILQLAVSLDYAIFLLHRFSEYREKTDDVALAMQMAMKKSFPAIAASAATTFFGFVALVFMDFRIGSDLGLNLVKGITLSFISVMVFLPAFTLLMYKLIDKTRHKAFMPKFKGIGTLVNKVKIPVIIIAVVLIVPSFLAQSRTSFTYGTGKIAESSKEGQDAIAIDSVFGKSNAIVILVPKGSVSQELALSKELAQQPSITSVVTFANMAGTSIPPEYLDKEIREQFYSENYCRIIAYTSTEDEGEEAFGVVDNVQKIAKSYYTDSVYTLGTTSNLFDMKTVVTRDNAVVNLIAVLAIAFVLLVTFKSISIPILLLITIETAIWINLAIPYFAGQPLVYIGYLVLSTVQLGATVDYAILYTDNYRANRKIMSAKDAVKATLADTFFSVLVSSSILASAGFVLYATSSNPIVGTIGLLLGRGTLLSVAMVIFFLPPVLALFDKVVKATTIKADFYKDK